MKPEKITFNQGALSHVSIPSAKKNESNVPVLIVTPSLRMYDGRSKPLPLMSEIPDPLTTITYGEWISISEKRAQYTTGLDPNGPSPHRLCRPVSPSSATQEDNTWDYQ